MSSTEETHECEECDTSFESKEELEKHNKEEQIVAKTKERSLFFTSWSNCAKNRSRSFTASHEIVLAEYTNASCFFRLF